MYICVADVLGIKEYEKDGRKQRYLQIAYDSKQSGFTGKRVAACKVEGDYKLGSKVKVADDFMRPQIIEE